jgi:integrase
MPAMQHGTVLKRAPGRYEARWADADGKRRAKLFPSKTSARAFLKDEVVKVAKQRKGEVAPDAPETVDALLDIFLERHGRTVDVATEQRLCQELKLARKTFGTRKPDSIKKAELEDWMLEISAGYRHCIFRTFRQALTWGLVRGLCEQDVSAGIRNPKRKRHERTPVVPFETWAEVESVAAELDARYRAIPVLAAGTGLRPEEFFGLHRADVDRERMRLHVHRRFTRGVVKQGTKTESERFVPFGQKVLAAIDAMPVRIDTPILFPAPRGGYIDLCKFRFQEWKPALVAASLPHRRVYDLRHTYASWSLASDVPVAKLARMMGTSIGQIEETYHRWLRDDEERYGSALDTFGVAV